MVVSQYNVCWTYISASTCNSKQCFHDNVVRTMQVTGRQSASPRPFATGQRAADGHFGQAQLQLSQPQITQEQAHYGQRGVTKAPPQQVGTASRPQAQSSTHWQQHPAAQQPAGLSTMPGPVQAMRSAGATVLQPTTPAMPSSLCGLPNIHIDGSLPSPDVACMQTSAALSSPCCCEHFWQYPSGYVCAVEAQLAGPDAHPELGLEAMIRRLQQEKDDLQRQ